MRYALATLLAGMMLFLNFSTPATAQVQLRIGVGGRPPMAQCPRGYMWDQRYRRCMPAPMYQPVYRRQPVYVAPMPVYQQPLYGPGYVAPMYGPGYGTPAYGYGQPAYGPDYQQPYTAGPVYGPGYGTQGVAVQRQVPRPTGPRIYSNAEIAALAREADQKLGPSTAGFATTERVDQPPRPGCVSVKTQRANDGGILQQWQCPHVN